MGIGLAIFLSVFGFGLIAYSSGIGTAFGVLFLVMGLTAKFVL